MKTDATSNNSGGGRLWLWLSFAMMALSLLWQPTSAYSPVYTLDECNSCINDGNIMCRIAANISQGACCDSQDPLSVNCTTQNFSPTGEASMFDQCSAEIKGAYSERLSCPYRWQECGSGDSNLV